MYKAIKNFEVDGRSFKIGETVSNEFVSDRLIRAKKISGNDSTRTEIKEDVKVEKVEEVILNEVSPVSEEMILTEDSSEVDVNVVEEQVEIYEEKTYKKRKSTNSLC